MNIPHDKFCVLPWISLETSPIGTVRPCCLADDEIRNDQGQKFDLNTASFVEIQDSQSMKKLRQQFLDGERPQTCRKCWKEEAAGRTSKRMHTINRLKHVIPDQEWTDESKPLQFLDLKLGNICNLKCRICGSWSSSTFASEEINSLPEHEDKKSSEHYIMLRKGAWPRKNQTFWSEIDQVLDHIQYIEFTGGEPFMIQEHFDMLERIVERGIAGNVEIHYNTNGTIFPERGPDIWQHFKTVEIAFSIDDIGERFEYQRSNAVWTEVQENIKKFFELKRYLPMTIQLQVCTTVNVFNVRYIDQVAQWLEHKPFNFVYWNMMHDAWYFSIANLPDTAKKVITQHLQNAEIPAKFQTEFDRIIDFMNNGASTDGFMTKSQIKHLDVRRSQNLKTVAPELATLLDYDLATE